MCRSEQRGERKSLDPPPRLHLNDVISLICNDFRSSVCRVDPILFTHRSLELACGASETRS